MHQGHLRSTFSIYCTAFSMSCIIFYLSPIVCNLRVDNIQRTSTIYINCTGTGMGIITITGTLIIFYSRIIDRYCIRTGIANPYGTPLRNFTIVPCIGSIITNTHIFHSNGCINYFYSTAFSRIVVGTQRQVLQQHGASSVIN